MYGDGFGFGGIEFPLRRPTMERKDRGGMIASEYERERVTLLLLLFGSVCCGLTSSLY
jgi:hypothetical protein